MSFLFHLVNPNPCSHYYLLLFIINCDRFSADCVIIYMRTNNSKLICVSFPNQDTSRLQSCCHGFRIQALVTDISSWDSLTNERVKPAVINFIHYVLVVTVPSIVSPLSGSLLCIHSLFKNGFKLFSACIGSVFQIQISCLFNHWLSSGGFAGPRLIFISWSQTEAFQDSRAGLFSLKF